MKLKVLATSVLLIFACFAEASNLKQFFGSSSGGSGIELKVATSTSNVCPACPAGSTSVGCWRGEGGSTSQQTGWLATRTAVGGFVISTSSTGGNCNQLASVLIHMNGIQFAQASTFYTSCYPVEYSNYQWGLSLCRVN